MWIKEIILRDLWPEGFAWTCEEPELLTDICDFTTQFCVILGRSFSNC